MLAATLISVAVGNDDPPRPGVLVEWIGGGKDATPTPRPTLPDVVTNPATPTLPASSTGEVTGFAFPVEGGCLPANDDLMPGAPRPYRNGIHEGVDFYDSDNCTTIGKDTEILAAKAGTVIRADLAYQNLTAEELQGLEDRIANGEASAPDVLDAFRGRQVWIDHGGGIVTRYCHLNGIADGITIGKRVNQGELVAYMGESGAPESVTDPGTQIHLHFELRVGDSYLGEGRQPDEVRRLYTQAFSR
jgi:murein DD-endopeptidase MepM/ murein hydrolase activator NlpD